MKDLVLLVVLVATMFVFEQWEYRRGWQEGERAARAHAVEKVLDEIDRPNFPYRFVRKADLEALLTAVSELPSECREGDRT